ncbi:MAG: hypothetical protein K2J02_01230, partial [Malacoplasma sp.]|nr:hypothetical protein [Malacoplasma sp.]
DYLKNILNQKNRLVNFLIKENQSDEANCLVEFRASQIYNELSAKVTEDQIKGINQITNEFEKNINNLENKTNLISAKNLKNKSLLYEKISELELEIAKLFDVVEDKKKAFIEVLSEAVLNQSDSEVEKIISRFENSKEMIQNEYFQELEAFKKQIFSLREKEIEDFKKEISIIESEINSFRNSDSNLISQKEKELEPLDNLIEELHFEISSFEQEKENHYKEVAEKLAYLNSLGSSKEKSFEDTVNTDKFKINLNNDVKEIIENEFMSFKHTFVKNLEQIKNGFNLIKSSYSSNDDEIDNPSWFTSFDEKIKNLETDIISEKINSEKNVNKNSNNNIKLEINGEKVKGFIVETESKKREIEDFYKKVNDLIELRKTKKDNS